VLFRSADIGETSAGSPPWTALQRQAFAEAQDSVGVMGQQLPRRMPTIIMRLLFQFIEVSFSDSNSPQKSPPV
jgi:hypothetical protein